MQDRTKLLLLIAISLLFAALFIGVGLNADNYQYFFIASRAESVGYGLCWHCDCAVVVGVSNHHP